MNYPEWWPENPYPVEMFPMTTGQYVEAVPNGTVRSAVSGCVGRYVWDTASRCIFEAMKNSGTFVELGRIGDQPCTCPKCGWAGTVYDCEGDVDGDGGLGCPECLGLVETG